MKMLYYDTNHCLLESDAVYFDDSSNHIVLFPPFMIACTRCQHCTVLTFWNRKSVQSPFPSVYMMTKTEPFSEAY